MIEKGDGWKIALQNRPRHFKTISFSWDNSNTGGERGEGERVNKILRKWNADGCL
jgi:hypothetical protein